MLPTPPSSPVSLPPGEPAATTGSTVGEAFAIAPDTYVVPGWWPFPGAGRGLPLGTLVVRGRATAVVDSAPALLEDDWLAAVLALVDPDEVRWIVATAPDGVRAGCIGALHALAPRATVVVPGSGCTQVDLGGGQVVLIHEAPPAPPPDPVGPCPVPGQLVVEVPERGLLWTDLVGGPLARPARDVTTVADDDLVAALAQRPRRLVADEVARTAALGLRVLGSPIGPIARGAGLDRVLALAARAEAGRTGPDPTLAALLDPTIRAPS